MKKIITALFVFMIMGACAQEVSVFNESLQEQQQKMMAKWEAKQFDSVVDILESCIAEFNNLELSDREQMPWFLNSFYYNKACAHSLNGELEEGAEALQASIENGWKDYYHLLDDSDLDNLRKHPRFKEIISPVKKRDFKSILVAHASYSDEAFKIPSFTYQNKEELKDFRLKYNLDSVAGIGELNQITNLMAWAHSIVKHDGGSTNPKKKSAEELIKVCQKESRGVNCRMMATILNEAYLSMGYYSRLVTCMPKGEQFADCHVINMVYSDSLQKWLWMDPTFNTYPIDEKGTPLSIQETRARLINDQETHLAGTLDWNGKKYSGGEKRYLHRYMTKNLFRFSCPLVSESAYEEKGKKRVYIDLYPLNYNEANNELGELINHKNFQAYYITNDALFWEAPSTLN
ncbi:MAG: hypothetical protein MRY83_13650 [Flavobacteriales bacterium]|nr:hypothetical protein [Flavobacteriales bacterium]